VPFRSSYLFACILVLLCGASGFVPPNPRGRPNPVPGATCRCDGLSRAAENILAVVAKPSAVTRWTFEQTTERGVRQVMEKAGLPAEVIARLLSPTQVVASGNNVVVLPKVEDLLAISQTARSALL
jgi:hypothetical protein